MSTLTDRYVWAVLRSVPEPQRPDLEPELRALVADAVEARLAVGSAPEAAEREALVELGDPDVLAARYNDRPLVLLGPSVYVPWKRLLTIVLPIAVTIGAATAVLGAALDGREVAGLVGVAVSAAINVAIQTVFWITLVFVVIERVGRAELAGRRWTPDSLPPIPRTRRPDASEVVTTVATAAITAGLLIWQQVAAPIRIDGVGHPLIDPALWSSWLPLIIAVLVAEILLALASYLLGRWTWTYAALNAVLALAFAVPTVWLLQSGNLLDPGLTAAIRAEGHGAALATASTIAVIGVLTVTVWEVIDGFLRARRWQSGELRPNGPSTVRPTGANS